MYLKNSERSYSERKKMALIIKEKNKQEILEKTNEFECTAEVFQENNKTFHNRVSSADKNQEFLRRVFGETRDSNYCELRKIEMHYLNELSRGIKYFIKTLDEENKEIADVFRMYYGHSEEKKEPMTVEEISDEMNIPLEKINEIMRLGYRILRHPSKRYLFLNHNQLRNYYNFHDEIFEMVSKKEAILDEIDQFGELNVEFNFKEHQDYCYNDAYSFYCKIESDISTDTKEDLRDFEDNDK